MNRRTFGKTALALAGAGLGLGRAGAQEDSTVFPIVDPHQHLWDLTKFRLPWHKKVPAMAKSHVMSDYFAATADLGLFPGPGGQKVPGRVVKTVYMEVDVAPEQQNAEADYVIDLCRRADNPMVGAVISGRPGSEGFAAYIKRFQDSAYIKGVRQVLHGDETPPGTCLEKQFIQSVRLLGDLGMSFDLCVRPAELLDAAKLVDACPDTRFVLDHCGNADVQAKDRSQWQRDIAAVAERKNVICKVSGIVASAKPGQWTADDLAPIIRHVQKVFGPDRVIFASDWPVCTLAAKLSEWVSALRTIVSGDRLEDQRKLFHDNAVGFYRLA